MVHDLSNFPGVHQVFLSELRDIKLQKNREAFRQNMEKLGKILAYEISKTLPAIHNKVETPLGEAIHRVPADNPVLCCVLRAGLPFFNGFQHFFPNSDSGFIGAYRGKSRADHSFDIELDYMAMPPSEGRALLLIDPMLATGKSIVKAATAISAQGKPSSIIIASLIASPEGIAYVKAQLPDAAVWTIACDEGLNAHAYILPGLGDAGDLSFGLKTS